MKIQEDLIETVREKVQQQDQLEKMSQFAVVDYEEMGFAAR